MFTNTCIYAQALLLCTASGSSSGEHEDKRTEGHALSFANCLLINQGYSAESSYVYEQTYTLQAAPSGTDRMPRHVNKRVLDYGPRAPTPTKPYLNLIIEMSAPA